MTKGCVLFNETMTTKEYLCLTLLLMASKEIVGSHSSMHKLMDFVTEYNLDAALMMAIEASKN